MNVRSIPTAAVLLALAFALPVAAQQTAELKPDQENEPARVISPSPLAEAEWSFLKALSQDKEEDVLELALPQLEDWLARNPRHQAAHEAQVLKANLHYKLGDYKSALVDLLKYFNAYQGAPSAEEAARLFVTIRDAKADKKSKPLLDELSADPASPSDEFNISSMLEKLAAGAGEAYYDALAAEFRSFFNRFPEYPRNDAVRLSLAGLHGTEGKHLAARLEYEKMIRLYPASSLLARAKMALGTTLADNLKEYDRAIEVFQEITVSLPGTGEAWAAYGRLPALAEKQKKYDLAVETYEKIIALYPDKEEAYKAYVSEAEVLRGRLKKYPEAVAVLNRLADKYKGERAIQALLLAAEICRKDLKDSPGEVKMYDRIADEYAQDPQAPKVLYAAGEVYLKAKDADNARKYFDKVLMLYPEDPVSRKATSRVADIVAGKI